MLDRILQWGPHEAQIALTVTMLVATAILALMCDVLRYRAWSQRAGIAESEVGPISEAASTLLRTAIAPTLVPEIPVETHPAPAKKKTPSRASRLAAALKQPRRALSPAARAAIERGAQAAQPAPAQTISTPAPAQAAYVPGALPAGFQSNAELARLTASQYSVTGLVVVVTLVGLDKNTPASTFQGTIASLLEGDDFAAPLAPGDFLLILPKHQGPSAQQRMSELSQRLWEAQMESLPQHGVSFQWGGLEVRNQPIPSAVRAALERREARGDRKMAAAQKPNSMQRAV